MKKNLIFFAFCAIFLLFSVNLMAQEDNSAKLLTPTAAIEIALKNNPAITQGELGISAAEAGLKQAQAVNLPTLAAGATGSYVEKADFKTANYNITLTWPILPWSGFSAVKESASANYNASIYNFIRKVEQVVYQTRTAYNNYLLASEMEQVAKDAISISENSLRIARLKHESGISAKIDVDQATASLESSKVSLIRAQNGVELAKSALFLSMGLPAGSSFEIATEIGEMPQINTQISELTTRALDSRADLKALDEQIKAVAANAKSVKANELPSLAFQAGYTDYLAGDKNPTSVSGITAGLSLNYTIFDFGSKHNASKGAEIQVEQVKSSRTQLELGVILDVQQSVLNLTAAKNQLVSAEAQLTASREALRIAELRYQEGQGILLEVDQARLSVTSAQNSVAQAMIDALNAYAALEYAVGGGYKIVGKGNDVEFLTNGYLL